MFRFAVCVVFTNQRGGKGKTTALWFLSAVDWRWILSVVLEVAGFLLDFIFLKLRKQLNEVYGFQELQLWPCISYVELSGGVQAEVSLPVYLSPLFQNGKLQWQTGLLLFYCVYVYLYNVLFQKKKEFKAGKNMDFSSTCRSSFIGFFWYHIYLLMIDMLMIWLIHWVGFIYIIISISSRYVFKDSRCPSQNVPFLSIGNLLSHKQTVSDPSVWWEAAVWVWGGYAILPRFLKPRRTVFGFAFAFEWSLFFGSI